MIDLVKAFILLYNACMSLETQIAKGLISQNQTLALAESCTGGLLSHLLTNIPGSSAFFCAGLVCYSNDAKNKLLKIPSEYIDQFGAVSEEIAIAMAQNVRKIAKTTYGVSITGIAGPDGGTKKKPVGLVYIAVATAKEHVCSRNHFKGSRLEIKKASAHQALVLLSEYALI